jgi:hypothetical protein
MIARTAAAHANAQVERRCTWADSVCVLFQWRMVFTPSRCEAAALESVRHHSLMADERGRETDRARQRLTCPALNVIEIGSGHWWSAQAR